MPGAVFSIVAPPRSGTKWFSSLFTHGDSFCYHELMTQVAGWPTSAAQHDAYRQETEDLDHEERVRRFFLDVHPGYFSRLFELLERGFTAAGNSDNGLVERASGVWMVWPATRFVFSIRNGINQVNSQFDYYPDVPVVSHAVRRRGGFLNLSPFEQVCRRWANDATGWLRERAWLEASGAACISTTLERMVSDPRELERVMTWVGLDWDVHGQRALSLMGRPVNSRINQSGRAYEAHDIWNGWTAEQRSTFTAICGEFQVQLGYELPSSQE